MRGEDSTTTATTRAPMGGAQLLAGQPLPESKLPSSEFAETQKIQTAELEQSIPVLEEKGQAIEAREGIDYSRAR
jgi:hypothetical protein